MYLLTFMHVPLELVGCFLTRHDCSAPCPGMIACPVPSPPLLVSFHISHAHSMPELGSICKQSTTAGGDMHQFGSRAVMTEEETSCTICLRLLQIHVLSLHWFYTRCF